MIRIMQILILHTKGSSLGRGRGMTSFYLILALYEYPGHGVCLFIWRNAYMAYSIKQFWGFQKGKWLSQVPTFGCRGDWRNHEEIDARGSRTMAHKRYGVRVTPKFSNVVFDPLKSSYLIQETKITYCRVTYTRAQKTCNPNLALIRKPVLVTCFFLINERDNTNLPI